MNCDGGTFNGSHEEFAGGTKEIKLGNCKGVMRGE